jgi:hypothetical protein
MASGLMPPRKTRRMLEGFADSFLCFLHLSFKLESSLMNPTRFLLACWIVLVSILPGSLKAQDFADPADIIMRKAAMKPLEIAGQIQSVTTNKPVWYGVNLDLGKGQGIRIVVSPATKFWGEDNKALEVAKAIPRIAAGQKIRMMHTLEIDQTLHIVWASDVMFVPK